MAFGKGGGKSVFGGKSKALNSDILQPGLHGGPQQPSGKGRVKASIPSGQGSIPKRHGKKLGISVFGKPKVSPGFPAGLGPKSAHDGY